MRPLRITQVIATLEVGGAERQVALLVERLVALGHEVSVLALTRGGPIAAPLEAAGARVEVIGKRGKLDLGALARTAAALARLGPDLVHAHLFTAAAYAAAAARLVAKRPPGLVMTQHGRPPWQVRGSPSLLLSLAYRPFDAALARLPALVTCPTAALAREVRRRGVPRSRLRVVPNAIDVEAIAARVDALRAEATEPAIGPQPAAPLAPRGGPLRIVAVGRLDPIKRVPALVAAVARLRQGGCPAVLRVVGEGADRPAIERAIAASGLAAEAAVEMAGHADDVVPHLAWADVFALASRSEGLPLAVLEAMAAGLPVVAPALAGLGEAVVDGVTGTLVSSVDPAPLAGALVALAAPASRASFGAAARARARSRFGLPEAVSQWLAVYAEAIALGRQARGGARTEGL